jgi:hypothetical protein
LTEHLGIHAFLTSSNLAAGGDLLADWLSTRGAGEERSRLNCEPGFIRALNLLRVTGLQNYTPIPLLDFDEKVERIFAGRRGLRLAERRESCWSDVTSRPRFGLFIA